MATITKYKKFSKRLLRGVTREFLKVVRGPWFLSAMSVALLLIPAAQATLLKGYIKSDQSSSSSMSQPVEANAQQHVPGLVDDLDAGNVPSPTEAYMQSRSMDLQAALQSNSFPTSFTGAWKCVTIVVSSAVPSVPVGETMQSQVRFARQNDGRILAEWQQNGWDNSQEHVTPMSNHEAALDRTNSFEEPGQSGQWTAHSHDHYLQLTGNRMVAASQVDQYDGGQFMGSYQTRSTLFRVDNTVALAH